MDLEMNQLKVVTCPANCCTSLVVHGGLMSNMAFIILGLASISLCEIIKPKNFPIDTPNAHLVGFSFIWYLSSVLRVSSKSSKCLLALYQHVIHVNFHILLDLHFKHLVYQSLIGGPYIFQSERHDPVAIYSSICHEVF